MMHNSEIYFEVFFQVEGGAGTFVSCFSALAGPMTSDRKQRVKTKWKEGARRGTICQKGETGNGQERH